MNPTWLHHLVLMPASLIVLAILSASSYGAEPRLDSVDMTLDIQPDLSVKETLVFIFESPALDKALNYSLNQKARDAEAFGDGKTLDAELVESGSGYSLQITLPEPVKNLTLSFSVEDVVFTSKEIHHLFTETSLAKSKRGVKARVKLPEGYMLRSEQVKPSGEAIISDGKRVILEWNVNDSAQPFLVSVMFSQLASRTNLWVPATITLLIAFVSALMHFRNRAKKEMLRGFSTDQRRTMEYLEKHKTALQRDVQREFQFSRAKATRIVKALEEKGVLKKEEQGRTNRLTWLG